MEVQCNNYKFSGTRADEALKYFNLVISHGYDGDMDYLAWESAHKFGQRVTRSGMASFFDGIVLGKRAEEAAEYIDQKRDEERMNLPVENRRKLLVERMKKHFDYASNEFDVIFKPL